MAKQPNNNPTFLMFAVPITIAVIWIVTAMYAISFLLIFVIAFTVLAILCVYKNGFGLNKKVQFELVTFLAAAIFITELFMGLKDDVVKTTIYNTFVNGRIISREVEQESDEGNDYTETKLFFVPATKEDTNKRDIIRGILIQIEGTCLFLGIFLIQKLNYKEEESKTRWGV